MLKKLGIYGAIAILSIVGLAGCSDQAEDQYSSAGSNLKQAAKDTGEAIKSDANKAGKALSNDETSAAVKQALNTAKDLKAGDIKVDTKDKMVTLSGMVPTAGEKSRAEQIAKGQLGAGYSLENKLVVTPEADKKS